MTIRDFEKRDKNAVEEILDLYWNDEFRTKISKRLKEFINDSPEVSEQKFKYFVAEQDGKVVGIISMRKCPDRMIQYAKTSNPFEIYILAVKNSRKGIGKRLVEKILIEGKSEEYTEALLYSGKSHKESWSFYDHLGFTKVGSSISPDGENGYVWRMELK